MITELITIIFFSCLIYYISFSFFRDLWVGRRKSQFDCTQCGDCCKTFNVMPEEQDIERIEKHGYKRYNFMEGSKLKRLKDGSCIFLGKRKDKYICKIHKFRPDVCRRWPFAEYFRDRVVFGSSGRLKCEAIENMNPPKLIPINSIKWSD